MSSGKPMCVITFVFIMNKNNNILYLYNIKINE